MLLLIARRLVSLAIINFILENNIAYFVAPMMHYVSISTATEIIYLLRTHFTYFHDFLNYADLGVGIPYLAGAVKSYFPHVNSLGVDLPDPIQSITEKLKAMGENNKCAALTSIVFTSFNVITDVLKKDSLNVMNHLRNCQVITNFIGIAEANESIIKNVLPGSLCRIIMFRVTNVQIPDLHHDWLTRMKFSMHPKRIKGCLALQV